ncbi:MAG TPA: hypothetical protein VG603_08460 [Chitinophagales bacterium]|nr:hypothetical protein [Chitinophagales bacterium]
MIPELINALAERLNHAGFIQQTYGLALLYKTNQSQEPVVFENGEPLHVDFDNYKSLAFFVLNGPITQTQRDSDISCGVFIAKRVPLRLFFYAAESTKQNCLPVDEDALADIIATLVFQQDKDLCAQFGLAAISMAAIAMELRPDAAWAQVFGNKPLALTGTQQLLSADFDLLFEGDPACWIVPCGANLNTEDLNTITNENNQNLNS